MLKEGWPGVVPAFINPGTTDLLNWTILCFGGLPGLCPMFSSTLGLNALASLHFANGPLLGKIAPG